MRNAHVADISAYEVYLHNFFRACGKAGKSPLMSARPHVENFLLYVAKLTRAATLYESAVLSHAEVDKVRRSRGRGVGVADVDAAKPLEFDGLLLYAFHLAFLWFVTDSEV